MCTSRHPGGTRSASMRRTVRASRTTCPRGLTYRKPAALLPFRTIHSAMGDGRGQAAGRRDASRPRAPADIFPRRGLLALLPAPFMDFVSYAVADRIATITVNRPDKLNALNDATIRELGEAIDRARGDDAV